MLITLQVRCKKKMEEKVLVCVYIFLSIYIKHFCSEKQNNLFLSLMFLWVYEAQLDSSHWGSFMQLQLDSGWVWNHLKTSKMSDS